MFEETRAQIVASPASEVVIKEVWGDFQPLDKTLQFEDGFSVTISNRLFCAAEKELLLSRYLRIQHIHYKIMFMEQWSDYVDVWLYQCKN